jgi:hypothetical protein
MKRGRVTTHPTAKKKDECMPYRALSQKESYCCIFSFRY